MQAILAKVGIAFEKESTSEEYSLGNPDLSYNARTQRLVIEDVKGLDAFGKMLGYKKNDELYAINGVELQTDKIREIITNYYTSLREGDEVYVTVYRPKFIRGHYKLKTLSAKATKVAVVRKNQISLMKDLSDSQKLTLKRWTNA
jgi:hypothetical protein